MTFFHVAISLYDDIVSIAQRLPSTEGQSPILAPRDIDDLDVGRLHRDAT